MSAGPTPKLEDIALARFRLACLDLAMKHFPGDPEAAAASFFDYATGLSPSPWPTPVERVSDAS